MPKFSPKHIFNLFTEGSNFGNLRKNSAFISSLIKLQIDMGPSIYVYRLKGTFDQDRDAIGVKHKDGTREATDIASFMGIQDTVLHENRDREYDFDDIPRLHGVYTVSQNEVEYARFGMAHSNDVITMEFHAQEMEKQLGRRFIPGDVVELPHLREVSIGGKIANKWYEVASYVWAPTGYDAMYQRHILAVILKPVRHQQEFLDLLEREDEYGKTLIEQASVLPSMMALTEANMELAARTAPQTMWDISLLYIDPANPNQKPQKWTDDLKPPNAMPVRRGREFPQDPKDGDWFIRTDLFPNRLYQLYEDKWRLREIDRKRDWQPYNWMAALRTHMSDRSEEDRSRKYDLRSIHDVLTDRESRSDPSPKE